MRHLPIAIAVLVVVGLGALLAIPRLANTAEQPAPAMAEELLTTQMDKVSYSLGVDVGTSLKQQDLGINVELLIRGIRDGLSDEEPLLSREERLQTLMAFQQQLESQREAEQAARAQENLRKAEQFLVSNQQQEGVQTTESGLQYQIVEQGTGATPEVSDTVSVHYTGTLLNGDEFDSSYSRGEPTTFRVEQVIEGWKEALQMMKEGAEWKLYIPPELAYGESGAPPAIGPNEVLIFDVKLLEVRQDEQTPPAE